MIDTVFRVYGKSFIVDKFLEKSKWKVICSWNKGDEIQNKKKIAIHSGFNVEIGSSKKYSNVTYNNHIKKIISFIEKNDKELKCLKSEPDLIRCMDIGITDEESFRIQNSFKGDILFLAHKYDIELTVSVYP